MAWYFRKLSWNRCLIHLLTKHTRRGPCSLSRKVVGGSGTPSPWWLPALGAEPAGFGLCDWQFVPVWTHSQGNSSFKQASGRITRVVLTLYLSFLCLACLDSLAQAFYSVKKLKKETGQSQLKRNYSYNYFIISAIFKSLI